MKRKTQSKFYNNIVIVIPCFNESNKIGEVIKKIKKIGYPFIIVVDDGSFDDTSSVAREAGAKVLRHSVNRGKGAATQTGLDAAKLLHPDIVVTMDGDDQHDPSDIEKITEELMKKKVDFVIGSRLLHKSGITLSRKIINKIGNVVTFMFYGVLVSDSQTGFRAYNRKALNVINSECDRYEFESDSLGQLSQAGMTYTEIPITVRYTDHSLNKYKGLKIPAQGMLNGFRMLYRMIIRAIL
jgi:glycosyltransferase involved in cell wall biosynthesis